jgi:hypothetical protein
VILSNEIFMYGYSFSNIGAGKEDILMMVRDDNNNIIGLDFFSTSGGSELDIARGGLVVDSTFIVAGITSSFDAEIEDVFLASYGRPFNQIPTVEDTRDSTYNYVTGVNERELIRSKNLLKVYPNPLSSGQLSIEISDQYKEPISFRILSINGYEALNGSVSSGVNQFDVSNLSKGVYMILIESEKMNNKRILIEKLVIN